MAVFRIRGHLWQARACRLGVLVGRAARRLRRVHIFSTSRNGRDCSRMACATKPPTAGTIRRAFKEGVVLHDRGTIGRLRGRPRVASSSTSDYHDIEALRHLRY